MWLLCKTRRWTILLICDFICINNGWRRLPLPLRLPPLQPRQSGGKNVIDEKKTLSRYTKGLILIYFDMDMQIMQKYWRDRRWGRRGRWWRWRRWRICTLNHTHTHTQTGPWWNPLRFQLIASCFEFLHRRTRFIVAWLMAFDNFGNNNNDSKLKL